MRRACIYIDGFNLYYGNLRGSRHKWLDLERYFRLLRPDDDLQQIHYFTALVTGSRRPNQEAYLKALDTSPLVQVVLGKFKTRTIQCRVSSCTHGGDRRFGVPEEKRTDVQIGLQMIDDAYQGRCERFVIDNRRTRPVGVSPW